MMPVPNLPTMPGAAPRTAGEGAGSPAVAGEPHALALPLFRLPPSSDPLPAGPAADQSSDPVVGKDEAEAPPIAVPMPLVIPIPTPSPMAGRAATEPTQPAVAAGRAPGLPERAGSGPLAAADGQTLPATSTRAPMPVVLPMTAPVAPEPTPVNVGLPTIAVQPTINEAPVVPPSALPDGAVDVPEGQLEQVVLRLASTGTPRAELSLNPPELGRVKLELEVVGDELSLRVSAANPAARELFEQALPRLRELLAGEGLQLGQTQVDQGGSEERAPQQSAPEALADPAGQAEEASETGDETTLRTARVTVSRHGALDAWA